MPICGAKRKSDGKPCTRLPVKGKTRCHFHGGKSTGSPTAATNPLTHGIYTAALNDEEKELYHPMLEQVGHIEQEITIARIRLFRALKAKELFDAGKLSAPVSEDLEEVDLNGDGTLKRKHKKIIKKHPDYEHIISTYLSKIGNLERIRDEMNHDMFDDVGNIARKIKQALSEIDDIE